MRNIASHLVLASTLAAAVSLFSTSARAADPVAPTPATSAATPTPAASAATPTPAAPAPTPAPVPAAEESSYYGHYRPPVVVSYEGGAIPRDSHIEERPSRGLIIGGLVTAGTVYAASLTYALSTCGAQQDCRSGSDWLYVPVVGPFITSGKSPTSGGKALAAFDGALQLGGLVMAAVGLLVPQKVVVTPGRASLRVDPISVGSGMGVGVTMTHF